MNGEILIELLRALPDEHSKLAVVLFVANSRHGTCVSVNATGITVKNGVIYIEGIVR